MSGSNKFARGGGRGVGRMPPPGLGRGMTALRRPPALGKAKERPDVVAAGKGRGLAMKGGGGGQCQEEKFQLVSCAEQRAVPLCAMAIRLTPGLLEALKREEELGESPMIKFGANGTGNVIKVGEDEFTFSSAPESGHLCDIFEEQKRGDKGDGLLLETGAVCQKLSVMRTLSVLEKNRVKARSVEAERQQKSRQAIILDHNNAVINNSKVAPSGDGVGTVNGRRAPPAKAKEPPLKKRKVAAGSGMPPLSAAKARLTPTRAEKPPVPVVLPKVTKTAAASPENPLAPSHTSMSQVPVLPISKPKGKFVEEVGAPAGPRNTTVSQKDKVSSPALPVGSETGAMARISGAVSMTDLRNFLITLLLENPKGLSIKAIDKALAGAMPTVRPDKKQVEKAIKAIASFQAPGKYLLKEGVEKGGFAKPSPGSASSPDTVPVESPAILADSPSLVESVTETRKETGGAADSDAAKGIASHEDAMKADISSQNSVLPLQRGSDGAVSRAIRKAADIVRGNAERPHPPGQEKPPNLIESPGRQFEELSSKDLAPEAERRSEGAESPASDLPGDALQQEADATETERIDQDMQNGDSLHSDEGEFKRETSDEKESSSATSSTGSSESEGEGDTESDSESASGRSGSGSETETDGSSSSGREADNMDEDVDIISDDDDKMDVAQDVQAKLKSKDSRPGFEEQEDKVERPDARNQGLVKPPAHSGSDVGMNSAGSDDMDSISRAGASEPVDEDGFDRAAKSTNSEEEIDVDVCDEDTPLPQEQKQEQEQEQAVASSAESGQHIVASDPELVRHRSPGEEVKETGRQENRLSSMPLRCGSESDHSIEEYETRAEINGVRGARVKVTAEHKAHTHRRRIGDAEAVASPRRKEISDLKVHTPDNVEAENKLFNGMALRDSEVGNGVLPSREHVKSRESPLKQASAQRAIPVRRDGSTQISWQKPREASTKMKPPEPIKRDLETDGKLSTSLESGEIQSKSTGTQRGAERPNTTVERSSKPARPSSDALRKSSGVAVGKAGGISRLSEETRVTGPDTRETITAAHIVRSNQNGDERPYVHRLDHKGSLGKSGEASSVAARNNDGEERVEMIQGNAGRPGRHVKVTRKTLKKGLSSERTEGEFDLGEKHVSNTEIQRRLSIEKASGRNIPKAKEPESTVGNDTKVHKVVGNKAAAKSKVSQHINDLEMGELRNIVAGETGKPKDFARNEELAVKAKEPSDSARNEEVAVKMKEPSDFARNEEAAVKAKEPSDLSSRQAPLKSRTSPTVKPRNVAKQADLKRRPTAVTTMKQQMSKGLPASARDNVRPASNAERAGASVDGGAELGSGRALDASARTRAASGDHNEKHSELKTGKRPAETAEGDSGRPSKRVAVDLSQKGSLHAEPDIPSRQDKGSSALEPKGKPADNGKGIPSADKGNHTPINRSKGKVENGRVPLTEENVRSTMDKEAAAKQTRKPNGNQKVVTGLPRPGVAKKGTPQSNGKRVSTPSSDSHGQEFFAPYEKKVPEPRGPISSFPQYKEYCAEYKEKYPIYKRVNTALESDREDFERLSRDLSAATAADDKDSLRNIHGTVKNNYALSRQRFKRMRRVFDVLHEELSVLKQRCKDYAASQG